MLKIFSKYFGYFYDPSRAVIICRQLSMFANVFLVINCGQIIAKDAKGKVEELLLRAGSKSSSYNRDERKQNV